MDTETSRLTSGIYMAVLGAGMGFLMQITMLVAQNSVEPKDMGVASSSTTLFRTLGSSFGVAIMGALFTTKVQDEMAARGGGGVTAQSAQLDAKSLAKLPEAVREAYQHRRVGRYALGLHPGCGRSRWWPSPPRSSSRRSRCGAPARPLPKRRPANSRRRRSRSRPDPPEPVRLTVRRKGLLTPKDAVRRQWSRPA